MSQAIWYYAKGGKEHGPITRERLQQLAQSGEVGETDLIWCEGMDEWRPASQIAGLITPKVPTGPPPTASAAESVPVPPSVEPEPGIGSISITERPRRSPLGIAIDAPVLVRFGGLLVVLAGLVLAMLAKGCDGIGHRYAQRLQARSTLAESQFADEWESRRMVIEQQQELIRKQQDRSDADRRRLEELDEELSELNDAMRDARNERQRGQWRTMRIAARDADANNRMWAVWREMLFLFGSIVLACGLLAVSIAGQGAERWVCLVMLAIVTFSLYVGGIAWAQTLLH